MTTRIIVFTGSRNEVMTRAELFEEAAAAAGAECSRPFEGDVVAAALRRPLPGTATEYCVVVQETR